MSSNDLIATGINLLATKLNLKANETAAVTTIVQGLVQLAEAEAENRGGPALLASLAKQHPQLASVIESIPEVKSLLPAAQ